MLELIPKVARYAQRRFDRRDFFKLAAVAGIAAAWGGQGSTQSSVRTPGLQPVYAAVPRNAQYGRQRGRYPVAGA